MARGSEPGRVRVQATATIAAKAEIARATVLGVGWAMDGSSVTVAETTEECAAACAPEQVWAGGAVEVSTEVPGRVGRLALLAANKRALAAGSESSGLRRWAGGAALQEVAQEEFEEFDETGSGSARHGALLSAAAASRAAAF